jgi:hypothetical protein
MRVAGEKRAIESCVCDLESIDEQFDRLVFEIQIEQVGLQINEDV